MQKQLNFLNKKQIKDIAGKVYWKIIKRIPWNIEKSVGDREAYNEEIKSYCQHINDIVNGQKVFRIGYAAFAHCTSLDEIILSSSISEVGGLAFQDTPLLKKLQSQNPFVMLNGILIDAAACTGSVTVPNNVTTIGEGAFIGNNNITSVTIPKNVTKIYDYAFASCPNLTSVTIMNPNCEIDNLDNQTLGIPGVTTIKGYSGSTAQAYANKYGYTFSALDTTATEILSQGTCGENLAWTLDNEGTLTISGTGEMYDYYSDSKAPWDSDKEKIEKIVIKNGVISIGRNAFIHCENLISVIIPDSVSCIGVSSFYWCTNLTSVTIPGSVAKIDFQAFYACTNLISVTLLNGVTNIGESAFESCKKLTSITIPESVMSIGDKAFYNCTSLNAVIISGSRISVGNSTFDNTPWLENYLDDFVISGKVLIQYKGNAESVTIPDFVTSIGAKAFENCTSMTSVIIPEGVTNIGESAFRNCENLVSVTIPDGVTNIELGVFYDCMALTSIIIPDGVTSIGMEAFHSCMSLKSIMLPDSVTNIGYAAFRYCISLKSITISNNVTSIGYAAFEGCWALTSVIIPDSITKLDSRVFSDCKNLTSITIKNSNCEIYDMDSTISNTATIYGYPNSTVQSYAEKYNRKFVALDGGSEETTTTTATASSSTTTTNTTTETETKPVLMVKGSIVTIKPGQQYQIEANQDNLTYSSSNPEIAVVSSSGMVTALKTGETVILVINQEYDVTQITLTVISDTSESKAELGDLTQDEKVDASDAAMILVAAAKQGSGQDSGLTEAQKTAADVNQDGKIDASDAAYILQYAAAKGAGAFAGTLSEYMSSIL